jgi:hypothetical protein
VRIAFIPAERDRKSGSTDGNAKQRMRTMIKTSAQILAVLAGLVLSVAAAQADDPPMTPPKGYTWANCPSIKAAFLKPDGWYFKSTKQGDTQGFFISKEKIEAGGGYTTGLAVNVIPDIPKKKSVAPSAYARQFRESARKNVTFTKEWDKDMGPFKSVGFVYTKKDKAGSFTVHNLLIANDKTGTMYLVTFEAPAEEWAEAWKIGEPMLNFLFIDDTI